MCSLLIEIVIKSAQFLEKKFRSFKIVDFEQDKRADNVETVKFFSLFKSVSNEINRGLFY